MRRVPRRLRRPLSLLTVAGSATLLVLGGALPASAVDTCRQVPAGAGGLDTVKVCTTVTVNTVVATMWYYTAANRTPPNSIFLHVELQRDGAVIGRAGDCPWYGNKPNDSYPCSTSVAGNVAGPQNYVGTALAQANGISTSTYTPINRG